MECIPDGEQMGPSEDNKSKFAIYQNVEELSKYIGEDDCVFEKGSFVKLAKVGQLMSYIHELMAVYEHCS